MPIYEYECTKCGNQSEVWQTFSDQPLKKCDLCGGRVKKLISQSTFHLKGTGWYVTDYASKSAAGTATKPESKEAKAAKSDQSDTKVQAKPASETPKNKPDTGK